MQSGYTVKRYSELPKTITLTRRSHVSIEVLPIAHMDTECSTETIGPEVIPSVVLERHFHLQCLVTCPSSKGISWLIPRIRSGLYPWFFQWEK